MTRDVQLARQDLLVDPDRVFVVKGGESVRGETRGKATMYASRQSNGPSLWLYSSRCAKHMATSPPKNALLTQPGCVAL